jgi:hypothetical protein
MIIKDFKGFNGRHCESSASGCLLKRAGMDISEPMLFGLGQGLGFMYWKMSIMNLPFIGGRSKQFELTRSFCSNMNIELDARETGSKKTAWSNVAQFVDRGIPVALQLDCYHLEHFQHAFHFAGHFLCVYGYNDEWAYVMDTGTARKVALENLEKARFEKGPMSAKARSWTLSIGEKRPALKDAIPKAIRPVALEFLNPAIRAFGYKGIQKLGAEIVNWIEMAPNPKEDLAASADLMENGGTGGALFRNFYRDFLKECLDYLPGNQNIKKAHELYRTAAANWTQIASCIAEAGRTGEKAHLEKASALCMETAEAEKKAMERLCAL